MDDADDSEIDFVPPSVVELNATIGDSYEIDSLLAAGGMGAVYRGWQTKLGREVAIKVLPPLFGAEANEFRMRFEEEARAMASLHHDHVVAIYDFGETGDGRPFLVMEMICGESLYQIMRRGRVPVIQALEWILQLCRGLHCVHEQNLVHLDIKPSNLMISEADAKLKIGDFGLVESKRGSDGERGGDGRTFWVTPGYSAPECLAGAGQIDRRADIYSVGVIFYELLTGQLPGDAPFRPSQLLPGLDSRLDDVVFECLKHDPSDRWCNAQFVAWEIERLKLVHNLHSPNSLADKGVPRTKAPDKGASGSRRWVVIAGVLFGLVGTGGGLAVAALHGTRLREQLLREERIRASLEEDLARLKADSEGVVETIKRLETVNRTMSLELEGARSRLPSIEKSAEETKAAKRALEERLQKSEAERDRLIREFEEYQRKYRADVRKKAPGTTLGRLEVNSGQTFQEVVIIEVTEAFVKIRHRGGLASVSFEDLSDDVRATYGYSPELAAAERNALHEADQLREQSNSAARAMAKERQIEASLLRNGSRQELLRSNAADIEERIAAVEEGNSNIRMSQVDKDRIIGGLRRDLSTINNELEQLTRESSDLRGGQ